MSDILIVAETISSSELNALAEAVFGTMVKGVVDIETEVLALGGQMHADEESLLLQNGSRQENLWGFNIYTDQSFPENIEFDSMINIRPRDGNRSRDVEDPEIRGRILKIIEKKLA